MSQESDSDLESDHEWVTSTPVRSSDAASENSQLSLTPVRQGSLSHFQSDSESEDENFFLRLVFPRPTISNSPVRQHPLSDIQSDSEVDNPFFHIQSDGNTGSDTSRLSSSSVRQDSDIQSSIGTFVSQSSNMTASTSVVNPMQVEYDRELPAEHAYLGALERVRGMQCLEAGQTYCIPVFVHNSLVFPGETIPMIARNFFFSNLQDHTTEDGILFGLVFPNLWSLTVPHLYGVTCQVFEKGTGEQSMQIKSRAGHRFKIRRSGNANFEELLMFGGNGKHMFANIEILPEVVLPDPLYATGSAARFGLNPSMTKRLRRYTAASTPWPTFLYDQYNIEETVKDVKTFLSDLKLDVAVSDDPVALSFWLAQNIPLSHSDRVRTFLANSVTSRMLIIGQSLDVGKYFCCRRCKTKVANYNSIFAMSREGVQSKYCNPSGYIHETNTVYNVLPGTVILQGAVYSEFSWFPGYKWQIANCCACNNHLGWEFTTKVRTYVPQSFFGLSGKSLVLESSITRKNEEQERLSMMIGSDSTTEFDSMETLSE